MGQMGWDAGMKRFWDKVAKSAYCWEWKAYRTSAGYGAMSSKHGMPNILAHRFSWELVNGPISEGMCILHKCDNRLCVNPNHLFLGTKKDNTQDMLKKGRNRCGHVGGVNHGRQGAKLDWEKAKEIRHLYFAERRTAHEIAQFYGLARGKIKDLVANRSWVKADGTAA